MMEFGRLDARIRVVRARIRDLSDTCAKMSRKSAVMESELAKEKFRLKALRWQLFRVHLLPTELLVEIFRYVVLSTHVMDGEPTQKLRLTWVCRRFREVALADGILWGRIVFKDPAPWERSLTFFDRAGETPLDLYLKDMADGVPRLSHYQVTFLMERLKTKAHNIRSLILSLNDWLCPWFVINVFSDVSAPQLSYMHLDRGDNPYLWTTTGFKQGVSGRPLPLFNGEAPNVARLILNGISVRWDSIQTAKLCVLNISRLAADVSPTLEQFRALLAAPNLSKLCLHAAAPPLLPRGQKHPPAVYMPKLLELRLGDLTCDSVTNVLSCLEAPEVRILALMHMAGMDYTELFKMLQWRFEKVEMLLLINVQLQSLAAQVFAVTWIDMMMDLRVLTVEGPWTIPFLRILITDPKPYRSKNHFFERNVPPQSMLDDINTVAPRLHTLNVAEVAPHQLAIILGRRELGGHPLSVVTIPKPIWQQWAPELQGLLAFLGNRIRLALDYPDHITKEEAKIRARIDPDFEVAYGRVTD